MLILLFLGLTQACLPGYWGSDCVLCPQGYVCDGYNRTLCTTAPMQGTAVCPLAILCPTTNTKRQKVYPVSFNSSQTNYSKPNNTCGCAKGPIYLELDFGSLIQLGGLVLKSSNGWIQTYFVHYFDTSWIQLGGLYVWESKWPTIEHNMLFPFPVVTSKLRMTVIDYVSAFSYPTLFVSGLSDTCCIALSRQNCTIINGVPVTQPCSTCCSDGYFSRDGGVTCVPCPAGYVCTDQRITECTEGNFCPPGSTEMQVCY